MSPDTEDSSESVKVLCGRDICALLLEGSCGVEAESAKQGEAEQPAAKAAKTNVMRSCILASENLRKRSLLIPFNFTLSNRKIIRYTNL